MQLKKNNISSYFHFSKNKNVRKTEELLLIFLFYFAFSLVFTYPAIIYMQTSTIGVFVDVYMNLWNLWWMKTSLLEIHTNPFFTDYQYFPNGITLVFHSLQPLNGLMSIPFQYLFNLITAFNIVILINFALSGLSMFLLAYYLTKNRIASLFAGFVFTFSPFHMAQSAAHMDISTMQWVPLFILFFMKLHREKRYINAVMSGIFLVLVALNSWYYLFYSLLFSLIFIIFYLLTDRKTILNKKYIYGFFLAFAVFSVIMSPLLVIMLNELMKSSVFIGHHNIEMYSVDILSFFIPSPIQSIGHPFSNITLGFTGNIGAGWEDVGYIGYVVMLLSILALYKYWRKKIIKLFAITALVFVILSLGPKLHIGGIIYDIILPYKIIDMALPIMSFLSTPSRALFMLFFSLSVFVAFSIKFIFSIKMKQHKRFLLLIIIFALLFLEYITYPYLIGTMYVPDFYYNISNDKEDYTIIDKHLTLNLYYQTIHKKKIFNGYISRVPLESMKFYLNTPIINNIIFDMPLDPGKINQTAARRFSSEIFKKNNIRYIVVSKYYTDTLIILEKIGFPIIFEDDYIKVFLAN